VVPFIPPDHIGTLELDALADLFGQAAPFELALRDVRRFPQTTYLSPVPSEPLIELTERVVAKFPGCPPYGGRYSEVVPHLTIADKNAVHAADAEIEILRIMEESGPVSVSCGHVDLYENTAGVWVSAAKFQLGLGGPA
jgi:2'-5' RNA ligase